MLMTRLLLAAAVAAAVWDLPGATAQGDTWPRFRGANGDGQSDAAGIPSEFTAADYAWQAALPGLGHSSPVVWNDRVFVTSAMPDSAELMVLCYDLATGEERWQRRFAGSPHAMHATNSYATSTPALDGDHLYVAWKKGDAVWLAAITHDGETVWERQTGRLAEAHGFGTSPVVIGDVVCITNDTEEAADSAMVGLDRRTGAELWRQPCAAAKTSYATPLVWQAPSGESLLLMSTMGGGLTAYEPRSGKIAWSAFDKDLPDRCVSSPVLAGDIVLISCGSGNNGKHLIGAALGSAAEAPAEAYRLTQSIPNIPTPVVAGEMVVLWYDRGVVTAIDAATGRVHWRERVGGNFHSSPVRVGDRIFGISLEGEVVVLAADEQYRLIARNELGERVTATPAVAGGRLLIRTEESLICLGGAP